jgi:hypothetical protein
MMIGFRWINFVVQVNFEAKEKQDLNDDQLITLLVELYRIDEHPAEPDP